MNPDGIPDGPPGVGSARVLVADDEAGMRLLVRCVLEGDGHSVVEASNGLEAVEAFLRESPRIDLVICDIQMPYLEGTELVSWLTAKDARVKVLCISGCAPEKFPPAGPRVGRLPKPFNRKTLQAKIRQMLEEE